MYLTTVKSLNRAIILSVIFLLAAESLFSQLVFRNPSRISGGNLQVGSVYRFSNVAPDVDALVRIDSLVNGAVVTNIDLANVGYNDAFQPTVRPGNLGISYALFTISFVRSTTTTSVFLSSVTATNLDLDGSAIVKEMCEIDMNGGTATFMSNNPQISMSLLLGKFRGLNLLGFDYNGIDTTAHEVMFKVQKENVSSFQVRFGALSTGLSSSARQFSLYMREFQIANATTLPVELLSFQATLRDKNAILSWTTTNHYNFSHFVVEKSTDARNFTEAAVLFTEENTSSAEYSYKYKDNLQNSTAKLVYYRLKMVDVDGTFTYSETRMVRLASEQTKVLISTFPNPVANEVRVMIPAEWQDKPVTYEVFNSNGLLMQRYQTKSAAQVQQLQVQQLNSGTYILKVSNAKASTTSKFIKY